MQPALVSSGGALLDFIRVSFYLLGAREMETMDASRARK